MKKFVFIYYGNNKAENMTEEQSKAVMEKWMAWYGSLNSQVVDGGNPFASNGMSVTSSETALIPADMWPAKGYTIIEAADMDAAVKIAQGCPMLEDDSEGTVRVYEALPM
ncbi:MAG: YciI family protein [bacterium]|nr:YciI family protein [bacterium]